MFFFGKIRICTGCLPKYEWNWLKISFKNTYFQVFQGFLAFKETVAHIQPNGQSLAKMAKMVKNIKKAIGTFSRLQALTNCKVSEKSNEQFPRKSVTHERTDKTPKVSNDFVERPKTCIVSQKGQCWIVFGQNGRNRIFS